jgi:hypothetical protein
MFKAPTDLVSGGGLFLTDNTFYMSSKDGRTKGLLHTCFVRILISFTRGRSPKAPPLALGGRF